MKPELSAASPRQRGITLVEILITAVVISIGLLGVAGLHLSSLRSGQGAHTRSQATALAHDIIDRMRANREAAITGGLYEIEMSDDAPTNPTTLVDIDKQQWLDALADSLPGGDGSVERKALAGRTVFEVTIQWHERTDADNSAPPNNFVTTAEL